MTLKNIKYVGALLFHLVFCGSMGAAVGGLVTVIIYRREVLPYQLIDMCIIGFVIGISVYALLKIVSRLLAVNKRSKKERYLEINGYCEEYFNRIKKSLSKKRGDKKTVKQLYLARELCDGRLFDEALEVIEEIKIKEACEEVLYDYYTVYFYLLVMRGEIENAEVLYNAGKEYISSTPLGWFSKGVFYYAKENYEEAEDCLELCMKKAKNSFTKHISRLFMGLVYVKTDRKELAKKEASQLAVVISNPVLKSDLKKLMLIIEREYGFERRTETEASDEAVIEKGENAEDYAGSVD